ncbi:ABC transporter ATP-binding protein [Aromatoleum toluclasticum]|uniref:ABC transporter ATP-binding protein n=1 Tax=Aromatoleum toluclasticum TaxID=92003 RepID=UPI000373DA3D|nr:ABC transporter ATP-binding protein [Aromatoleum toluclasticum]
MTTFGTQKAGRIELRDIAIHLPGKQRFEAVRNIGTTIAGGEFVSIIGPSGCGKSTLLNAVAGYLKPSSGRLHVDGEAVSGPGSDRGMVFQHHSLLPWRTALDNVAFGLKMSGVGRRERRARAEEFLRLVGLAEFSDRYPAQLSGGMQQRVEIARVLINNPRVVLMDEPFGALDAQTRERMQQLLLEIWGRLQPTVLFVTHDIDEALVLSDRVLVMTHRPGRIREEILVDLRRPRPEDITVSPDFIALKKRCLALVQDEVRQSLVGGLEAARIELPVEA